MPSVPAAETVTIRSRKYDGAVHIEWPSALLRADASGASALSPPDTLLLHHTRGLRLPQDHYCLSLFPAGRWWNAMLDFAPDGQPLGVYCNVTMPYSLGDGCLEWVDLDLDVLMARDRSFALVDEDEFADHTLRYAYPAGVIARARAAAADLLDLAARAAGPFRPCDLAAALRDPHALFG